MKIVRLLPQGANMKHCEMVKGYVAMVLHSHIPFVRHPDKEDALEERWLFEAMSESYIPLIQVFDRLILDNVNFKITVSLTPPLMNMLEDKYLNERFVKYLNTNIQLAKEETIRTKFNKEVNSLANFYVGKFSKILETYYKYDANLMNAFRKFDKLGNIEFITSAATHGILPLLSVHKESLSAQVSLGVETYVEKMGHKPNGIWLPECAYSYNLDSILKENNLKYFIMESIGLLNASPEPLYGTFAPIITPNGIIAFGRDIKSSRQLWSSLEGYPGDYDYREFYRDIGYDLPMEYIAPYINRNGIRIDTGIKYYKITGKKEEKLYYNREKAMDKAKKHAEHFVNERNMEFSKVINHMDVTPIITCPYDTELFGHWWYEGPEFIENFLRNSFKDDNVYKLITPSEFINNCDNIQCCSPNPSSWGDKGDYSVWINPSNQWVYKEIHICADKMINLSNNCINPSEIEERALNQAARELLLAESSDWTFIIKNNTAADYASKRVKTHVERFNKIYNDIINNIVDIKWLENVENIDNIFPHINFRVYKSKD